MKKVTQNISNQVKHVNAAGIDIGSEELVVAVDDHRCQRPVRTFSALTPDLVKLCHWLKSNKPAKDL